ncbi:UvrD-helicase domain-containing protein [Actinomadura parmotrematis]|uniref:DNA 3'-5' helicase n=1 Tax=Actinomadura parmotrematis TaxID=2864039 RepID=A0ABS7FWX8_9ACTN|nr:UvrD-helicase domain-containing protein [Actinomadura parmotrematis]MBW8483953.1 AAA family ATPase [Actinomadura parmotrematis]
MPARTRGDRARAEALELSRRSRDARAHAARWTAATDEQRRLAAGLLTLTAAGWRLLAARDWPAGPLVLVGPGGVFAVLTDPPPDALRQRAAGAVRIVEEKVAALGMSPVAVHPVAAFTAAPPAAPTAHGVRLVAAASAVPALLAEPKRLTPALVRAVADHLADDLPGFAAEALAGPATAADAADALFSREEAEQSIIASRLHDPIETWMTFLHPDQLSIVRRDWSGPARVSGPAGTGKTVVGLHRAVHLAGRGGRVLYVTYARNLPRVQEQLFGRMAPRAGHVEFSSLHAWATTLLASRDVSFDLKPDVAETAFSRAWMRAGRDGVLAGLAGHAYWKEEIDHVIKGRGLATVHQYRAVDRPGRRTALRPAHRDAVWNLYLEYERLRAERGVHDFNDVLSAALAEVEHAPPDPPYTAVIVDEVQDLTLVGVRLLHALAGDAPNGLLVIGDGQQAVYPGGYRLADAGVSLSGRGAVLRTNYRNAAPILQAALDLVSGDPFDDLDGPRPDGRRTVEPTYHKGGVVRAEAPTLADHDRLLTEALTALPDPSGAAVLCRTNRDVDRYAALLTRAGVPVLRLDQYDATPAEAVKLGTYIRAKGLEFKQVYLPRHNADLPASPPATAPDTERAELARRQLFVAMTRARDLLWLGSVQGSD